MIDVSPAACLAPQSRNLHHVIIPGLEPVVNDLDDLSLGDLFAAEEIVEGAELAAVCARVAELAAEPGDHVIGQEVAQRLWS